jgi:hypothetical protein
LYGVGVDVQLGHDPTQDVVGRVDRTAVRACPMATCRPIGGREATGERGRGRNRAAAHAPVPTGARDAPVPAMWVMRNAPPLVPYWVSRMWW